MSLGGLLSNLGRSAISTLAHTNPLTGGLYDLGAKLAAQRKASGGSGPSDPLYLTSGGGVSGGGTLKGSGPQLPALPSGGSSGPGVKIIKTQKGADPSKFSISPGSGTVGHWTKKGVWSSRRRPRMNAANIHALRRSVRRLKGAEKMFRRVLSVTHTRKPGKVRPKFGRKR